MIDPELKARRDRLEKELDSVIAFSDLRAKQTHWVAIYLMIVALVLLSHKIRHRVFI